MGKSCVITAIINENGAVEVKLHGRHINKRELLRVLKAVKNEHRENIRQYRMKQHLKLAEDTSKNIIRINKVLVKEIKND